MDRRDREPTKRDTRGARQEGLVARRGRSVAERAERAERAEPAEGPTRRPGRPPSPQAHRAILDATLDLLAERGYGALTIEGVAARAGVAKSTIYRRWPSKLGVVVAAW